MKAILANKVLTIESREQKHYQLIGYDITDDNGKIIAYGAGKTVPYEKYLKVVEELNALKAKKK